MLHSQKFLNQSELDHLESRLKLRIRENPRDCLLILITMKTGARASEVLNLRKEDINRFSKTVFIRGLKGSNDRELPIISMIFNHLVRYMDTVEGELIFPISYERMVQIWTEWRPVKKSLKALRHSFGVTLYRRCKDLRLVQSAMGHKAIQNTMVYQTYVYTQSEFKKVML